MVLANWNELRNLYFEDTFPGIGGASHPFEKVYVSNPNFVKFALIWKKASGRYLDWKNYCEGRRKYEHSIKVLESSKISDS